MVILLTGDRTACPVGRSARVFLCSVAGWFRLGSVGDTDDATASGMKTRIMYIEDKSGGLAGPARIGRVTFSKTGRTIRYRGRSFQSLKGHGFKANYYDVTTGERFWISGPKRRAATRSIRPTCPWRSMTTHGKSISVRSDESQGGSVSVWRDITLTRLSVGSMLLRTLSAEFSRNAP